MGLKKPDEKGAKKSEGLASLLRSSPRGLPGLSELSRGSTLKGEELEKALQYVLSLDGDVASSILGGPELSGPGGICYEGVTEVVRRQLDSMEAASCGGGQEEEEEGEEEDQVAGCPGRLGPRVMHVDRTSVFGRYCGMGGVLG